MAHARFIAEVLTPEGEAFNEEVEMVSTRTTLGLIGILANHAPLLARLEPTELRLYRSENEIVRFAQGEGYVQVVDTSVLVRSELERLREEAERVSASADADSESAAYARREIRRVEAFLSILDEK